MDGQTEVENVAGAKKNHRCTWCAELIQKGAQYKRWRSFYQGDASTVKMHPECYLAFGKWSRENGYGEEWYEGEFSRGCICGKGECQVENCKTSILPEASTTGSNDAQAN